ncbi:MAG: TRAP transporter small permease subunit [Pseudomonadota bacterium]
MLQGLSGLDKASTRINKVLAFACGALLLGISFLTCADIVMGFLLRKNVPGVIEIIVLIIPWVVCLGLTYALIRGAHVRVTLLTQRLSNQKRRWVNVFAYAVGLFFFGALTYGAWLHFWSSWVVKEPMFAALMTLPWWLGKLALPIGFFFITVQFILMIGLRKD